MLVIDLILILDAIAILVNYHCFRAMAYGRRTILGDVSPVELPSELYAAQTSWRRKMPEQEIVIRLDMDGFRATFNPDDWPNDHSEYLVIECGRNENDVPENLDVWEMISQEAGL